MAPFFTFLSDQGSTLGRYQARLACSPTGGISERLRHHEAMSFPERVSSTDTYKLNVFLRNVDMIILDKHLQYHIHVHLYKLVAVQLPDQYKSVSH